MTVYRTPFHLIEDLGLVPFRSNVYVVSDSTYKEYQAKEAQAEIERLEARAVDYEKTAVRLREEIGNIKKQHSLLPQAELPN